MTTGLRLLVACCMCGLLLLGNQPLQGAATTYGGGGTTQSIDGTNGTITVNMDFCCSSEQWRRDRINTMVKAAQDYWNEALAAMPYKGCVRFSVSFVVHFFTKGEGWKKGFHHIIEVDLPGVSGVTDPWTKDPTRDTDSAYSLSLDGLFFASDMWVWQWSHEIGHLMGLGDDYKTVQVEVDLTNSHFTVSEARPLPGRGPTKDNPEGTLMAGGKTIDQNLVDRLGNLAHGAGMKVPGCNGKHWTGTLHANATVTYTNSANGQVVGVFTGIYDGSLVLTEDTQGAVTGHAQLSATGCNINGGHGSTSASFDVIGTDNGKQLELQIVVSSYHENGQNCGFGYGLADVPGSSSRTATIPITSPGVAEGDWRGVGHLTSTTNTVADYHFRLTCTDCK